MKIKLSPRFREVKRCLVTMFAVLAAGCAPVGVTIWKASHSTDTPAPLLIIVADAPIGQEGRFRRLTEPMGFVVVQSTLPNPREDTFSTLLNRVERQINVDRSRIFIVGYGNGATRTAEALASSALQPAGVALIAGIINETPAQPFPVLLAYGDDDPNEKLKSDHSLESYSARWANGINCSTKLTAANQYVAQIDYSGCDEGGSVKLIRIFKHGHGWPGVTGSAEDGPTAHGLSYEHLVMDFFGYSTRAL